MKLVKFDIQNFRNITNDNEINFKNYSVLVGRNNEGKTTVLIALRLAMDTLKLHSLQKPKRTILFRSRNGYDWERDFPISLQKRSRGNKNTIFKLYFKLTEDEQIEFRKETGSRNNGDLCIQITFDPDKKFEFLIPKKGSTALSNKSNQIAEYIARKIQFTYIPAVRTEQEAINVINEMIEEELAELENDPTYQDAMQVILNLQQPVLDNVAHSIQRSLHKFLPNINNVELSILESNRRINLRKDYLIEIDDGDLTDIKFKGDGVKSLTAIGLLKDRNKIINGASIIAIEEPESHLHPSAMHELKQAIQKLSEDSQVVVSTHNPIFVDRETLANNLLVSNNKVKAVRKISEIRTCLGIRTSDNLIHSNKVILVEGESDKKIITKVIQERSP
ncbi:ATP-dependent nuclease [Acinetobacter sp. ANC 3813]|uniref:ATP-dependent nuclease n=1 Tax=Acinetobacter sp. ANC 3813 TaxID=1977873 RepID=UPI001D1786B7|nr:ATP-binding protein [Acinetobacter sp. ANC 3813]